MPRSRFLERGAAELSREAPKWLFAMLMIYLANGMLAKALAFRFNLHVPGLL